MLIRGGHRQAAAGAGHRVAAPGGRLAALAAVRRARRRGRLVDRVLLLLPPLLLLLSFTTGLVDATSVLGLGKVFTANMTGNIVFLGFAAVGTPGFAVQNS